MRDRVFAKKTAIGRRRGAWTVLLAISVLWSASVLARAAASSRGGFPEAHGLARGAEHATSGKEKSGTAFFVDDMGDMLTARHVVDDCQRVVVVKDGLDLAAQVLALSDQADLALIKVPRTLGLGAVFSRSVGAIANDMVFVAAFDNLPNLIASGGLLANATVVANARADGTLEIESNVIFEASGAPVLDEGAHVQGVISRRSSDNHVIAVGVQLAKEFLVGHGIAIAEDDRPKIAALGSRAHRAASISVAAICLQN